MAIDDYNNEAATAGGTWAKLRTTDDPPVEGVLRDAFKRDRTDPDGNVVYKRGTQTPRIEWVFVLEQPDGELVKLPANEGCQIAVRKALDGQPLSEGGTLKVGVKENPADSFSQAEYQAKWTPPAPATEMEDF